jgi:threonine synthase
VPIASGALFVNTAKAARELVEAGLVASAPIRYFGAQPSGCGPVAAAYAAGSATYSAIRRPDTIAHSLAIGTPADGNAALRMARDSGGSVVGVSDAEIVDAIRLGAETEGIFVEPAGGVTLASLARLARSGALDPDATVVAYLTGNGYKAPDVVRSTGDPAIRIAPTYAAFEAAVPDSDAQVVGV